MPDPELELELEPVPHAPEPEHAAHVVHEPSTPSSVQGAHQRAEARQVARDAWSPAHRTPGFPGWSERRNFWLWLAWRLRDATVVVADEVIPASEITSDSELVMIELNRDAVGTEAMLSMQQRTKNWRTVEVSTSLEDTHCIIVQVDSAGRALSRRVDDIANEVRGHAVDQRVPDIVCGQPCLLHSRSRRMLLWLACFKSLRLPIALFREYFGEQVTLYFELMEEYIRALQPLSVAGVMLWLIELRGRWRPNSSLASSARAIYRVLVNIWALAVVWGVDRRQRASASSISTTKHHQWETVR